MAKSLNELSAAKGFKPDDESAQEVQQPTAEQPAQQVKTFDASYLEKAWIKALSGTEITLSESVTAVMDKLNKISETITDVDMQILAEFSNAVREVLQDMAAQGEQIEQAQSKNKAVKNVNVIKSIGNCLFVPTDTEYQNAFITSISKKIGGIFRIDENGKRQLALDVNMPFICALAEAVYISYSNRNELGLGTSIYFPFIAHELGYDINHRQAEKGKGLNSTKTSVTRAEARTAFAHKVMAELDNIWGTLPNDRTEYKLISVLAYNPETETLYFVSPYLQRLIEAEIKHSHLLHSTAANERNRAAVEMATRILVGVQQRGLTPDAKLTQNKNRRIKDNTAVTWEITCKGLIEKCPQIRERLKAAKSSSNRTQIMQRAFIAMYHILKTKSDICNYYVDLTITEIIPTSCTLTDKITVKHHGGNPNFRPPALPLKEAEADTPED